MNDVVPLPELAMMMAEGLPFSTASAAGTASSSLAMLKAPTDTGFIWRLPSASTAACRPALPKWSSW